MFILGKQNEPQRAAVHLVRRRRTALRGLQRTGDIEHDQRAMRAHAIKSNPYVRSSPSLLQGAAKVADPFFVALPGGVKWQGKKHFAEKFQRPL
jgi:hypothetical protein